MLSNVRDTPEYVDRRQVMVRLYIETQQNGSFDHLYVESQSGSLMCVTHLNTWIEGKSWFICT